MASPAERIEEQPRQIRCRCGHTIFDGIVIKSRVVRVRPDRSCEAKCRCKDWHRVPLKYSPP